MNLEKVDMIHLDSLIERLIKEYKSLDQILFELSEEFKAKVSKALNW